MEAPLPGARVVRPATFAHTALQRTTAAAVAAAVVRTLTAASYDCAVCALQCIAVCVYSI
jgi:hypothetical protein